MEKEIEKIIWEAIWHLKRMTYDDNELVQKTLDKIIKICKQQQ